MHGKIPQECVQTVIRPICKNTNGDISDAGNYMPVSLATIIFKLLEQNMLSCISPLLEWEPICSSRRVQESMYRWRWW